MQEPAAVDTAPRERELLTVKQFAERYPAWTPAAIRALIYASQDRIASGGRVIESNKLREAGAVLNCGRRVLIDLEATLRA